jgi:predicted MPP superfamily phosphohydrolase
MIGFPQAKAKVRNLEERLASRRAAESLGRKTFRNSGHNPVLVHCHRFVTPLLRIALRSTGLYARGIQNALQLQVRHHRLSFSHLPEPLNGFRILHLSDLHIDGMDGLTEVLCSRLSSFSVDLCVLTGDYRFDVEGPCEGVYPRMQAVLGAVRSRLGVAGILGNHDCAEIALEMERLGVRMLIDESMEVERDFWATGADETGGGELSEALQAVPGGAFHMLLAHTPELYAQAAATGVALYLCGHTHGGQVCLPGGGAPILNARPRGYARGLWKHGETLGFTSSGAGCCMLPVRYNCPPEITVLELVRA